MNSRAMKKPPPMTGGDGKARHPLVHLRETHSPGEIAKWLGHANHTTVSIYVGRARKARTLPIPAEWVLPICRHTGMRPGALRPDLYLPHWTVSTS